MQKAKNLMNGKWGPRLILLAMLAGILLTRLPGLMHGAALHPDEHVFYNSASSVVVAPFEYTSYRDYPSGGFLCQMPFQFLGRVFQGEAFDPQLWGRLASVFYFCAGAALGLRLVRRLSGGSLWASGFYAAIMVFSLLHIEQSRYGTGDVITLFFVMAMLNVLQLYRDEKRPFYLCLAAFLCGGLAAVKYPLLIFIFVPIAACLLPPVRQKGVSVLQNVLLVVGFTFAGLLLFTPDFYQNPRFFMEAFFNEFVSYVELPNPGAIGSPLNNLASAVLYHLLYADFPLALPLACYGVWLLAKKGQGSGPRDGLYAFVLPAVVLVFFVACLVVETFFFRTLYPFFFVCNLYVAVALGNLTAAARKHKKWFMLGTVGLAALMALRGLAFSWSLTTPASDERIESILYTHPAWESRTAITTVGEMSFILPYGRLPGNVYEYSRNDFMQNFEDVQLLPGEFAVTSAFENGLAKRRLFSQALPAPFNAVNPNWETFKAQNAEWLIGQTHSEKQHLLYGAWLHGSTLAMYEFPINYIYHRPAVNPAWDEKVPAYALLRTCESQQSYMAVLQGIEDATLLVMLPGDMELVEESGMLYPAFRAAPAGAGPGYMSVAAITSDGKLLFFEQGQDYIDLSGQMGVPCYLKYLPERECYYLYCDGRWYPYTSTIYATWDGDLARVVDWTLSQAYYPKRILPGLGTLEAE